MGRVSNYICAEPGTYVHMCMCTFIAFLRVVIDRGSLCAIGVKVNKVRWHQRENTKHVNQREARTRKGKRTFAPHPGAKINFRRLQEDREQRA